MTLDLHTLDKIRAEVQRKLDLLNTYPASEATVSAFHWERGGRSVLTDILHDLDTEIAKAKDHD